MLTPLIEAYGEFSEDEVNVFREVLRPTDVVLEVGANIGAHTLALAELVPIGKVVAIEPQRLIFQTLCANLALNSVFNVEAMNVLIGAAGPEVVKIQQPDPYSSCSFGSFSLEPTDSGQSVVSLTIDSLGLEALDFIKLDCEGAELNALRGAGATMAQFRPAVYFEFDKNRQELIDYFKPLGYLLGRHQPKQARNAKLGGPGHGVASDMVLAWPPDRPCTQRMANGIFGAEVNFRAASPKDVYDKP